MLRRTIDPRHLQVLAEVARTGSYTAAAEALGYTQPAVSYQMRRLQQEIGSPVVVRAGRGVQLTQTGRLLLRHADTVLTALKAAEQEAATLAARGSALVRIAAFQSSCATLVPLLVTQLRQSDPALQIVVHQAEPDDARRLLRSGEADLGLLCNWENEAVPEGEVTMQRVELLSDRRCVVMRRDHRLADRERVSFADLAQEGWVMESGRDRFEAACTSSGFTPRISATVDDHVTIQALVAAGLGISLMTELALQAQMDRRLVARPLHNWPLRRTYALLWPDMKSVPAVATVLRAIRRSARKLSSGPLVPLLSETE